MLAEPEYLSVTDNPRCILLHVLGQCWGTTGMRPWAVGMLVPAVVLSGACPSPAQPFLGCPTTESCCPLVMVNFCFRGATINGNLVAAQSAAP